MKLTHTSLVSTWERDTRDAEVFSRNTAAWEALRPGQVRLEALGSARGLSAASLTCVRVTGTPAQ